jgi:hypothetical protein
MSSEEVVLFLLLDLYFLHALRVPVRLLGRNTQQFGRVS